MKSKYTKEILEPIIKNAKTWSQALRDLGLKTTGGNHRHIVMMVKYHNIDFTHFMRNTVNKNVYTKDILEQVIKKSKNWASVLKFLNLEFNGNNNKSIRKLVTNFDIDYSHFTGCAWNKGLTQKDHPSIKDGAVKLTIPNEKVFIKNGHPLKLSSITKRLILDYQREYKCSNCNIVEWQGKSLSLDLDHINGNNRDNRLENLRFLCPNCHRQTSTWGNKHKR